MHNLYAQAKWEKLEERKLEGLSDSRGDREGVPTGWEERRRYRKEDGGPELSIILRLDLRWPCTMCRSSAWSGCLIFSPVIDSRCSAKQKVSLNEQ